MDDALRVLMVAAENDALPGGKVGGIGDVVRDVPPSLADLGCEVGVVTPSYGVLAGLPGARRLARAEVPFGYGRREIGLFTVPGREPREGVTHFVLDGPGLASQTPGEIYQHDAPGRPFATDASKFALFSAAVATFVLEGSFGELDVVHLHDWHAALVLLLARYDPRYAALGRLHRVFTVHNLALQGVRPLEGDPSSLEAWFPGLGYERRVAADPRWPDCVNPMAIGIRLADVVHTVSPTYAREILRPSRPGSSGGEGLEHDLQRADREGRLHGILNGCTYPDALATARPLEWRELRRRAAAEVLRWAADQASVASAHFVARERLREPEATGPGILVTTIGRLTDQKVELLGRRRADARTALEHMLEHLGPDDRYVVLGTGDPAYERLFTRISAEDPRLLFLCGYSESLSAALYASGDLFLMPSSFEPCGISQMLAMRAGQPCLVHAVGGLRDTVRDGIDGFAFEGESDEAQSTALLSTLDRALELRRTRPERWRALRATARAARFEWSRTARAYCDRLYRAPARAPTGARSAAAAEGARTSRRL